MTDLTNNEKENRMDNMYLEKADLVLTDGIVLRSLKLLITT